MEDDHNSKFKGIMEKCISSAVKDHCRKIDVVILSDLKRMSERGVLIIETTQPDFEHVYMDKSISLRATVHTRLRFIGEETILDQRELIKKLKKQVADQQLTIDVLKAEHDDSE